MKYESTVTTEVDAFVIQEISPDFHGYNLYLLENGQIISFGGSPSAPQVGDYYIECSDGSRKFCAKATFESTYTFLQS